MMNLPYLIHQDADGGERTVVQTNAIIRYLGRMLDLQGDGSEATLAKIDQVIDQTMDLRNKAVGLFYSGSDAAKFNAAAPGHVANDMTVHYHKLDAFMEENNTKFSAANVITSADFHLFEMLLQHNKLCKFLKVDNPLETGKFKRLAALCARMEKEPRLKCYFDSKYSKFPLNNPHAAFR